MQYNADESHIFFKKQPTTPAEEKQAKAAMAMCPVDAIGDDGE
ncbi:4Fe-4S single cluster domain protein [Leptospira meyeri serovar Hardjo str. Went 5]|nr:4Fe-4S single cluster domain protein [Leptospira meyeri serovar Hardjo str. Went 5]EMJ88666.1 4Fe-4S single cluster domain protein [Leptospira meyeri serovar Semaranga str. Veldrot Semarang 173]